MTIRDALPSDAPFLAQCIMAGMHFYDFEGFMTDNLEDICDGITECEGRDDTLYSYTRTRVAEIDGKLVGALLSYPGDIYKDLRDRTFRQCLPDFVIKNAGDELETVPGEYYLDSLAVLPEYRRQGIGSALLRDGIAKGLSLGYATIVLLADSEMPNLIRLYGSLGFTPSGRRHAFGTDFQRMVYSE